MLAVGTYYSIYHGWLHLSLQGLGLFGAILLFVVIFFVIFGLIRGYGLHLSNALPLGFTLFYISLWAVSPNILYNLADIFPPANGILLILFIFSLVKIMLAFFRHSKSPSIKSFTGRHNPHFSPPDTEEIDREISGERIGERILRRNTMKLTKIEIKTTKHIEEYLKGMIEIIRESGNSLSKKQIDEITNALKKIVHDERVLKRGLNQINDHLGYYKSVEKRDISELKKRLAETKDKKKARIIQEEIFLHSKMIEADNFIQQYESAVLQFIKSFDMLLNKAMQQLQSQDLNRTLGNLEGANRQLLSVKHIYEKMEGIEKTLLKLNRKVFTDLKKEKRS